MKQLAFIVICLVMRLYLFAQSAENALSLIEQQLELQAENDATGHEGDALLEQLAYLSKHPVNLNEADASDLKALLILNDLQINSFLQYRQLLGRLISIYEIQAVPGWNTGTINRLLPFITVSENTVDPQKMKKQFTAGTHSLLFRSTRVAEKSNGYTAVSDSSRYLGSPVNLYLHYTYRYKNLLQWGIFGQKDAGEQFFSSKQKSGFDFYSFHLFLRNCGVIKSLAVGDFTVNMGQGLMQWQTFALKKSDEIASIKRQSAVLEPYSAAGEYNFFRGAGITVQKGKWVGTCFLSSRKISGNAVSDTISNAGYVTSLLTSGYHRTYHELDNKNNLRQLAAGGCIKYEAGNWHVAASAVAFHLSMPLKKDAVPYNLFALNGSSFMNTGIDYSYTYKNMHLFGEAAINQSRHAALVQGLIVSADPKVDISLLCRLISKNYQALYTGAFTENTTATNEAGIFAGIAIRPSDAFTINAYADVFRFPWLTYTASAPSYGKEYFIKLTYAPDKRVLVYTHFRSQQQQADRVEAGLPENVPGLVPRQNWRMQCNMVVGPAITIRNRFEVVWYDTKGNMQEEGFLAFVEAGYKPPLKPYSGNARLLYFETQGYNSRLYAFENDVKYAYSLPVFYDKGVRCYVNVSYDVSRLAWKFTATRFKMECQARVARTVYPGKSYIGSGPDQINGNKKTEVTFQVVLSM